MGSDKAAELGGSGGSGSSPTRGDANRDTRARGGEGSIHHLVRRESTLPGTSLRILSGISTSRCLAAAKISLIRERQVASPKALGSRRNEDILSFMAQKSTGVN